jgi:hypothetical protein
VRTVRRQFKAQETPPTRRGVRNCVYEQGGPPFAWQNGATKKNYRPRCSAPWVAEPPLIVPGGPAARPWSAPVPPRVRATGQGISFNFGRIFAGVGGIAVGTLSPGGYARMGAIVSLIYVAGMLLIWFAPETKGKPLPE